MKEVKFCLIFKLIVISLSLISFDTKRKYLLSDDILGVYVNGELNDKIPSKDGALFQKAICDDESAKVTWDSDNWGLLISNLNNKVKCNLYFYSGQTVFDFDYTGNEQTFTAPVSGTYRLETWGSSGYVYNGDKTNVTGGLGGYSSGNIKLQKGQVLYINVGGAGIDGVCTKNYCEGGYNGGGRGAGSQSPLVYSGSGGGATHIATKSGLLSSLENFKESILIVAGGGGGNSYQKIDNVYTGEAGNGGGFHGTDGTTTQSDFKSGKGATQESGGDGSFFESTNTLRGESGTFGQGGNGNLYSAGGGGGYYGGGASNQSGGGGGAGYIGNSLLMNKVMYCYNCEESLEENTKTVSTTCKNIEAISNCTKGNNGYARITLIGINE